MKTYSLQIDQPSFNDEERLQAVLNYFEDEGKSVIADNLHIVKIDNEKYRILSRSENSTVLKTLFTPNLAFQYMIRLEKVES